MLFYSNRNGDLHLIPHSFRMLPWLKRSVSSELAMVDSSLLLGAFPNLLKWCIPNGLIEAVALSSAR